MKTARENCVIVVNLLALGWMPKFGIEISKSAHFEFLTFKKSKDKTNLIKMMLHGNPCNFGLGLVWEI